MTISIKNYDGTEKHQMLRHEDGFEVVTELLLSQEGKLLNKTCRRGMLKECFYYYCEFIIIHWVSFSMNHMGIGKL